MKQMTAKQVAKFNFDVTCAVLDRDRNRRYQAYLRHLKEIHKKKGRKI